MAAFTMVAWVLAERESLAPGQLPVKRSEGRPLVITAAVERYLAELVDQRKQDIDTGKVRVERPYERRDGRCTDAEALRSVMLSLLGKRLTAEGLPRREVGRQVAAFATTPEFKSHVDSNRVRLSNYRRRSRREFL